MLTRWWVESPMKLRRSSLWMDQLLRSGKAPTRAAPLRWCATCKQDNTMRTTLRLLAISSLVLMLAAAAGARTRPHYGGTVRVESNGSANSVALAEMVTET